MAKTLVPAPFATLRDPSEKPRAPRPCAGHGCNQKARGTSSYCSAGCESLNTIANSDDGRRMLAASRVTLNGQPATLGGVQNDFASVGTMDCSAKAEWSWIAAARIVMYQGGDFWSIERPKGRRRR